MSRCGREFRFGTEDFQPDPVPGLVQAGWAGQARPRVAAIREKLSNVSVSVCGVWRGEAPNNVVAKNEEERNNNNSTSTSSSSNNNSNTHTTAEGSSKQKKSISRDREDEVHKVIAGGFFLLVLKFLQSLGTITRFTEW